METSNCEIASKLKNQGASLVGFADISDLPGNFTGSMKSAVSIALALDASVINDILHGPTERYYQEYKRANEVLTTLCRNTVEDLKRLGNNAVAINPTVQEKELDYKTLTTPLPHKTMARRAGLGWIGKSALLVTEKYGAAVRLATVLSDAEFEVGNPTDDSRCGSCKECAEYCPANAISGQNWELGSDRDSIYDAFACCDTATRLSRKIGIPSIICGICINVCPWTQRYISRELSS